MRGIGASLPPWRRTQTSEHTPTSVAFCSTRDRRGLTLGLSADAWRRFALPVKNDGRTIDGSSSPLSMQLQYVVNGFIVRRWNAQFSA
jgi:hypothetical protein